MTNRAPLSRRQILGQILGTGLCLPFAASLPALVAQDHSSAPVGKPADAFVLSPEDDQFLNDLEAASFLFFWEQGNPNTGMIKDRCNVHDPNQLSRLR